MIRFGKIKKSYNGQIVLDIDNFNIIKGKVYAITGTNGSGKSTLAKIIAGLLESDSGYIKINDISIGYVPQKPYVFDLTLEKNIMINSRDKNKCEKYIKAFNIEYLCGKRAKGFSGGEQQKLALARFMMKDYDLAIFDEPTSAMDEKSQNNAENIIMEYSKGKTVIIITHDKSQINKLADITINMNNGKIVDGIIEG